MTMGRIGRAAAVASLLVVGASSAAWAGPYGDALSTCLLSSSTPAEKTTLVRWIFATMALHPDVRNDSTVTPEQRSQLSMDVAAMFTRFVTEVCLQQTRDAIWHEGLDSVGASFNRLGQAAATDLFTDPDVAAGLAEPSKYLDEEKLSKLAGDAPQ
jgi:hypothetical protein